MMNLTMLISTVFLTLLVAHTSMVNSHRSEDPSLSNSKSLLNSAELVMSLESGGAIVRRPRGSDTLQADMGAHIESTTSKSNGDGSVQKPFKNPGHGNKKLSKNQDPNTSNGVRNKHHSDKKQLTSGEQHQQQQHTGKRQQAANRQQHGSGNGNGSLRSNKQRQQLKSQQHQDHRGHQNGKRNGGEKSTVENKEHGNGDVSKAQSTCRYAKSAWSDCDAKTNTHSRTLTLKRGDQNCPATRTIQKKCKKACRYEKGTWSECKGGAMTRVDNLKTSSEANAAADPFCEATRSVNKKCNPDGNTGKSSKSRQNGSGKGNQKERKNKVKNRTNTQQD